MTKVVIKNKNINKNNKTPFKLLAQLLAVAPDKSDESPVMAREGQRGPVKARNGQIIF